MVFTRVAAFLVTIAALVSGCSSSGGSAKSAPKEYYVSIGDSYAAGFQPTAHGKGSTTRNGFAYQLTTDAAAKGYHLTLQNFGCAGATTTSILKTPGCDAANLGPGAQIYGTQTQAAAAEAFLRAHAGHIALV